MAKIIRARCTTRCWYRAPDAPAGTPRRRLSIGEVVALHDDDPRLPGKRQYTRGDNEGFDVDDYFEPVDAAAKPEPPAPKARAKDGV